MTIAPGRQIGACVRSKGVALRRYEDVPNDSGVDVTSISGSVEVEGASGGTLAMGV